jgi:O-antigen/teichoic acid export membrane protein
MDLRLRSDNPSRPAIRASLRSGSVFLSGSLMLSNAVAQAYQMLLSRMLSPADYGSLVTLTAIMYVLIVLVRPFQAWVLKAVAEARKAGVGAQGTAFRAALGTLLPLGIAAFAAHWLARGWIAGFLHLQSPALVVALGAYAFAAMLVPIATGTLMGLGRLYLAGIVGLLEPIVRLLVGLILVSRGLGVIGATISYSVGNVVPFALALVFLWPLLGRGHDLVPQSRRLGSLDRYSLVGLAINVCLMVIASADQVAVKHLFSDEVAGNYAVAFLLGRVILAVPIALGWVLFTRSATMPSDDPGRARLLVKWLLLIGGLGAACTSVYFAAPNLAVTALGGSQYGIAGAYVGLVGVEMTLFSLVYVHVHYQMSVRQMQAVWPLGLTVALGAILLVHYHASVQQMLLALIVVMAGLLVCVSLLSWWSLRSPA